MIIVVGLAFEARIAAGPGVQVICSGDGRNLVARLTEAIYRLEDGILPLLDMSAVFDFQRRP